MKEKILIIDDEPQVAKLIELKLKNWGYETVSVNDPHKGIETAEKEKPDLALLDIMMPELDGISVCSEMRKRFKIPVIMISSLNDHSSRHDAGVFGAIDYVAKPIDDDELKSKIENALKVHRRLKEKKNEED